MTEATTATSNPTVDDIVMRAYRLAGLLSAYQLPNAQQAADARLALDDIVKETAAEGLFAKSIKMTLVTLVASQTDYVMGPQVVDVVGSGMFISDLYTDVAHANSETPIMPMDREEWQRLSARAATGRPYRYWADRSVVPVTVRIWPMPDSGNLGTMRLQAQELPADVTLSSVTAPFDRYWTQYLCFELAHQLAVSNTLPIDRCTYLEAIAQTKFKKAKAQSKQQKPTQARLFHTTQWRR